jgi:hypothetical protein
LISAGLGTHRFQRAGVGHSLSGSREHAGSDAYPGFVKFMLEIQIII